MYVYDIYICMYMIYIYIYVYICIYIYIYITNCRQYCFGLLGLISAVLKTGMEAKLKKLPQILHMW